MKTLEIERWMRDRDEALLSLDRAKIEAYMTKYGEADSLPKDDRVFWMSIHKARTGARTLPMEARSLSKQWLTERGLSSFDDGDVPLPPSAPAASADGQEG
jgi:hypothetical protein